MAPPALGTPAPRRPAMRAAGRPSAVLPVFEAESSSPATFPWTSRIVWAVCSSFSSRATFASSSCTFALRGLRSAGFPTAFARGQALKRPLTPRPAPFRQMGAVQPLAAKQPAHLAGLRAALCLLQNPQSILRGELAPLRLGHDLRVRRWPRVAGSGPGGLVATLLDPQGRSVHLLQCHRFLSLRSLVFTSTALQ